MTFFKLVNSSTTGLANLRGVFGSDLTPRFRNWATMLILDDVAGADVAYQEPSWNFRSIYDAITTGGTYPLKTVALAAVHRLDDAGAHQVA